MSSNNTIHIIRFTPRRYVKPRLLRKIYLVSQSEKYIITQAGKKIRL